MMEGALAPFAAVLAKVALSGPQIPYPSNVSGDWITAEQTTSPEYWTSHLRQGVNFSSGVKKLLESADYVFLEVGPGATLASLASMHSSRETPATFIASAATRPEQGGEWAALLGAMGKLWQAGVLPDWRALHGGARRHRVALPTYPFERSRYFVEPGTVHVEARESARELATVAGPGAGEGAATPAPSVPAKIREIISSLSGFTISPDDEARTFLELGFDSLFLSQFARAIEVDFGVPVTFRELTDDLNTVQKLSMHVQANAERGVGTAELVRAAAAPGPAASARPSSGVLDSSALESRGLD